VAIDQRSAPTSTQAPASAPQPQITRIEIDGVPVFSAPVDGPLRAALLFRVGKLDETLASNGITHLVEHLALTAVGQQPYQYNGFVDGLLTGFGVTGTPLEIVDFFQRLTAALANLPFDRLAQESRVLNTEQASRKAGPIDSLLSVRFGPTGWGLGAYPEYGLHGEDPSNLDRWRAQSFTRENAAFTITGSVPEGFRLDLPHGSRRVVPQLEAPSFRLPAWMAIPSAGVGLSMVAERSTQLTAVVHLAERRAQARLRYQEGVSYQVAVSYLRLNAQTDHVTLWADALPDNATQVRDGLLTVVEELIASGPTDEEIQMEVDLIQKTLDEPDRTGLQGEVARELLGASHPRLEDMLIELRQSSPGDFAKELEKAIQTGLMIVPEGLAVGGRFQPIPPWSEERLTGRSLKLRGYARARPTRLILAPEGITMVIDSTRAVTIRFDRCAALLTWTDGSRTLMANDGSRIHLRPADWNRGESAIQQIDRRIPKDRYVPLGDRPKPDPAALTSPVSTLVKVLRWMFGGLVLIFVFLSLTSLGRILIGEAGPDDPAAALVYGFLGAMFSYPLWRPYVTEARAHKRRARRAN
jgi:zinc protease